LIGLEFAKLGFNIETQLLFLLKRKRGFKALQGLLKTPKAQ